MFNVSQKVIATNVYHLAEEEPNGCFTFIVFFPLCTSLCLCFVSHLVGVGMVYWIIRINHECEGRIEKSVPRITDWHYQAFRVMTTGDREGRILLSHRILRFAHHYTHHFILEITMKKTSRKSRITVMRHYNDVTDRRAANDVTDRRATSVRPMCGCSVLSIPRAGTGM